jgi:hypothetical protein
MTWLGVVAIVLVGGTTLVRLRPGGPGLAVAWVPKSLRPRLNGFYRRHGWPEPYDDNGDRAPGRRTF